jgi:hypothetical protein
MRLARMLSAGELLSEQDAVLTGLVQAMGLLKTVLWFPDDHAPGWQQADRVRAQLPEPVAVLVAHTEAAVADAVLTHRS